MKIRHTLEFFLFQIASWLIRVFPLSWAQSCGALLGEFVFTTLGFRKNVTLENLRHAFPNSSASECEKMAREAFRSVGIALFELLWFPRFDIHSIKKIVKIENAELINETKQQNRGIVLLSGHFGNWELLAQAILGWTGIPVTIIVKTQANHLIDRKINSWRTMFGNNVVPMELAVREALKTLKEGGILGVVADQTAAKESISVDFFGRRVPTYEGPATLCLKTGAMMLIGFAVRQNDGTYVARFERIPSEDLKGSNSENVAELTRRHVRRTEEIIRQHPGQWMWMHRRWKHVEDLESPAR